MKQYHGVKVIERGYYGYRADQFDPRDYKFDHLGVGALPPAVDLRADCPAPMDQGNLGSCTAHGITGALRYLLVKKGGPRDHRLSRLQLYFDERVIESSVYDDAGAEIRDGIKCAANIGIAHETMWPYVIAKFTKQPTPRVYKDAALFKGLRYERVDVTPTAVKAALASGYPVIIGFAVFESFESAHVESTGLVPMPNLRTEQLLGGHCVYMTGYGQHPGTFTCRNSWGIEWGDAGDFYLPEAYINDDYCGDFWVVPQVTGIVIGKMTYDSSSEKVKLDYETGAAVETVK